MQVLPDECKDIKTTITWKSTPGTAELDPSTPAWQRTEKKRALMEWEEAAQSWSAVNEHTRNLWGARVARVPGTAGMQLTRRGGDRSLYVQQVADVVST